MTITEFLTARLDEREAAAREAVAIGKIHARYDDDQVTTVLTWRWGLMAESIVEGSTGAYGTSYHDGAPTPEEVLADVAAKRRIVLERPWPIGRNWDLVRAWHDTTVGLLALPYAEHPDYREEWRP